MKIYTKKGDKGTTGLLGGTRISKGHLRIEAYGTVDELNAQLGLVVLAMPKQKDFLISIQNALFTIGSHLSMDPEKNSFQLPELPEDLIPKMEKAIDQMEEEMPPLKSFVLPGGSEASVHCHIVRCICRRAERQVVRLSENTSVDPIIIQFLNRLSDYFFSLSRYALFEKGLPDVAWNP